MMVKTQSVGVAITLALPMAFLPLPTHGQTLSERSGDRRAIEFPDTDAYQTLVVDLHTHSVFSDGNVWPSIRMREAALDGLDAIAVTEHRVSCPRNAYPIARPLSLAAFVTPRRQISQYACLAAPWQRTK